MSILKLSAQDANDDKRNYRRKLVCFARVLQTKVKVLVHVKRLLTDGPYQKTIRMDRRGSFLRSATMINTSDKIWNQCFKSVATGAIVMVRARRRACSRGHRNETCRQLKKFGCISGNSLLPITVAFKLDFHLKELGFYSKQYRACRNDDTFLDPMV